MKAIIVCERLDMFALQPAVYGLQRGLNIDPKKVVMQLFKFIFIFGKIRNASKSLLVS